ncbi:MAG: M1 family metallopeptidase [bacterium]|nr:M1 family metallopeptidase [bacterium]
MKLVINPRPDPHSYFRTDQPRLVHVDWIANVDFHSRTLGCTALLKFDRSGIVDLDTRDFEILAVTTGTEVAVSPEDEMPLKYELAPAEPIIGSRLRVTMPDSVTRICITYRTSPNASALQWLTPAQTAGKQHPFLFSQGECLHTRSFLPCQDSPGVRFTYVAELSVPSELRGLMAATHVMRKPHPFLSSLAIERWEMEHPIPAYLVAFAVGDLVSRDLSPRSRVWAEPALADKAAWEFAETEKMIVTAEELFGPYPWGRFDILVLPPSFPYGGMENPTLVFMTPALLAGDRSMVRVVAHELAHAWTGNLVTNETWGDFWLNEGWTTYAEMRICEALYGRDAQELMAALLGRELERDLQDFTDRPWFTHLATNLPSTIDPDDVFSRVPYMKGYLFLRALEEAVGREEFDAFIQTYIKMFAFRTIDTATFLDCVATELPSALEEISAWRWVYGPGIPEGGPTITSPMAIAIEALVANGSVPQEEDVAAWNGTAWTYYLEAIPRDAWRICQELEVRFALSKRPNVEIRWTWYLLALASGVSFDRAGLEEFLASIGRVKYLKPLYQALAAKPETLTWAREVFDRLKPGYHPIAVSVIGKVLAEATPTT